MGLIPTEFWEFCFSEYQGKGQSRREAKEVPTARHTPLLKRALAHVAIGNSGGVGRALVRPRTASGVMVGWLSGTGRATSNHGLGTDRAT